MFSRPPEFKVKMLKKSESIARRQRQKEHGNIDKKKKEIGKHKFGKQSRDVKHTQDPINETENVFGKKNNGF